MPQWTASLRLRGWPARRAGPRPALALAIAASLVTLAAGACLAEEALPPHGFRIASWDVSQITELAVPRKVERTSPAWRTTFGSERRSEHRQAVAATTIDADAVLLQGVTSVAFLRRLFPARHWRLVVSRQWLNARPDDMNADSTPPLPVTAVAVRTRQGLRISGREHLLDAGFSEAGAAGSFHAAPTAVRLSQGARALWVVSVGRRDACEGTAPECLAHSRFAAWRHGKRAAGEDVVIGGRLLGGRPATLPVSCAEQGIDSDLPYSETQMPHPDWLQSQDRDCVAMIELAP